MTAENPVSPQEPPKPPLWRVLTKPPMLLALFMGFSAGVPLLLTLRTLQAWMTESKVDLKTIGIFALVGLPYNFKFIWSPLLDRYSISILGRRRGWMLLAQLGLIASIAGMAFTDPRTQTALMAGLSVLVAFCSATQDIVIDAYRRESLRDDELALGSTLYVYGYRIAMLLSGAGALAMASRIGWNNTYLAMAGVMVIGVVTTLMATEPKVDAPPPRTLKSAVIEPLSEFFQRDGAWLILGFILTFKLGDTMGGAMATPFYLQMGFTKDQIAAIAKTFGLLSNLGGSLLGGLLVVKYGMVRCLYAFGLFQSLATLSFALITFTGPSTLVLTGVIAAEDLSTGMGTAALVAFMGSMTSKRYTATQYALLSSLMGVPRTLLSAPTGSMVEHLGWPLFFVVCAVLALPALFLIKPLVRLQALPADIPARTT